MYSNKNLIEYVGNQNSYLLLTTANNNKAHRCLWNHSTTSGNPSGMYLVEVDGNQAQNGTPHGMSQSECTHSGLTSTGNPSGMNLSNGSPMLGDPTSTKKRNSKKKGHNQTP